MFIVFELEPLRSRRAAAAENLGTARRRRPADVSLACRRIYNNNNNKSVNLKRAVTW